MVEGYVEGLFGGRLPELRNANGTVGSGQQ